MKISKTHGHQLDSFKSKANFSRHKNIKKKDRPEFDFLLEDLLRDETKEWDKYAVLLPRHRRSWDNTYKDVE